MTKITWLGHSAVHVATPKGTSILIDPYISQNPKYPKGYKLPEKIDLVLLTHGHFDHVGDTVSIAKEKGATVIGMFELAAWVQSKGVERAVPMGLGGSYQFEDVTVTLVEAKHSSGIQDGDRMIYGGSPAGLIVAVEGGPILYHAGDTSLFSDMKLIGELYQPQLAMLPIGGHFTMGPREAATAAKWVGAKRVLPLHFGTFPPLVGTPEQLEQHLGGAAEVLKPNAGESLSF